MITVDLGVAESRWRLGREALKVFLAEELRHCLIAMATTLRADGESVDEETMIRDYDRAVTAFLER
jgi:hypothetical protein